MMVYKETDVYIKARKETSVMKNIECTFYRPAQVNIREFQKKSKTLFRSDSFVEPISFDYLKIEVIEE